MTSSTKLDKYAEATVAGAWRGLIGMPLEHPLEMIKTKWQSLVITNPHAKPATNTTFFSISKHIYQHHNGVQGFYHGLLPNCTRAMIKTAYRFPMMIHIPNLFASVSTDLRVQQMLTAGTIATVEAFIICPLERLKVHLMTVPQASSKGQVIALLKMPLAEMGLFRGLGATFARGAISWFSFLVPDAYCRMYIPYTSNDPWYNLILASACVGIVNTFCVMPFDFIKTMQQHYGEVQDWRRVPKVSMYWTGWQARMVQFMVHALMTMTLLQSLRQGA